MKLLEYSILILKPRTYFIKPSKLLLMLKKNEKLDFKNKHLIHILT